jgi:hypothetical protein
MTPLEPPESLISAPARRLAVDSTFAEVPEPRAAPPSAGHLADPSASNKYRLFRAPGLPDCPRCAGPRAGFGSRHGPLAPESDAEADSLEGVR